MFNILAAGDGPGNRLIPRVVTERTQKGGRSRFVKSAPDPFFGLSEADRLKLVAAAEHARTVATRNAPGLFPTTLRKPLTRFITQDDEDTPRRRIRDLLYPVVADHGPPPAAAGPRFQGPHISDDARIVREVIAAARRA